ncbi:DUF6912 family protein [Actinomadura sp. HBU206391]|uniref:DUF6912 family protein n=1 Tax=Actinomadura sp. HBU206391 TaxID=2731692 RepID=UPI0016504592|nr:hypothetical protein [Actinomadura sp. HBU206391]MBC6456799.1 hypothetical protein [Actinomadura sp. HBU206391]
MRVYLPSTLPSLGRALAAGEIGPVPLTAYAVTPELREWYAEGDLEELEYAALTAAARASLRMLADDPAAPPRRVVLAVEVPDQAVGRVPGDAGVADEDERAAVRLTAPVPAKKIASGHVDDPGAADDVRAAAAALAAADAGDDDARFTVDGAEGHELLWYATQELSHLLP